MTHDQDATQKGTNNALQPATTEPAVDDVVRYWTDRNLTLSH